MRLKNQTKFIFYISIIFLFLQCQNNNANLQFISKLPKGIKRSWINENFWANRLQDWQLNNGRIECINGELPLRTAHLLPYVISKDSGHIHIELEFGTILQNNSLGANDFAGLILGAGSLDDDFRKRAVIYGAHGKNAGIIAAVNGKGKIIFLDNENEGKVLNFAAAEEISLPKLNTKGVFIHIDIKPVSNTYSINLSIIDKKTEAVLSYAKVAGINKHKIEGNIALVANGGCNEKKASFWFKDLSMLGNKLEHKPKNTLGPIVGTIFTNFEKKLHLTAQFMPLAKKENKEVILEISEYKKEDWQQIAKTQIDTSSYTAKFNVSIDNENIIHEFRVVYKMIDNKGKSKLAEYKGVIPKNKNKQDIIKLAILKKTSFNQKLFTNKTFDFSSEEFMLPNKELTSDFNKQKPDLFLFFGEQVNANSFEKADFSSFNSLKLNYLYKWYLWHWSFSEITNSQPSILIPNNKDFFTENINDDKYEYLASKLKNKKEVNDFLQLVNKTQCSSEIFCNTENNKISNLSFKYGNIDFAFLANEVKKEEISEDNLMNTGIISPENKIDSVLIEQLDFIKKWSINWGSADIKAIITQNPIIKLDTLNTLVNKRIARPNNEFVSLLRKPFAVIISGTENENIFFKHGIKNFGDASYNYISPSLQNPPETETQNLDFFTNANEKIKLLAKTKTSNVKNKTLSYGLVKFKKFQKTISFENRVVHIKTQDEETDKKQTKYKNWSKTISVKNNYAVKTPSYLPLLRIKGTTNLPVVYIYESKTKQLIYAKKIKKMSFKPKVYFWSRYDIVVIDPVTGKKRVFEKVLAKNILDTGELIVRF